MRIIPVICTNCAAPLTVSENTQICNCQYCGSSFYIEYENTAPVYGKNAQMIRNAEIAFNKLKDYRMAFKYYKEASYEKADDFRGYAGMLYSRMEMLGGELPSADEFKEMKNYYESALTFADPNQARGINEFWFVNVNRLESMRQNRIYNIENEIAGIKRENANINNSYHCLEKDRNTLYERAKSIRNQLNNRYVNRYNGRKLFKRLFFVYLLLIGKFIYNKISDEAFDSGTVLCIGVSAALVAAIYVGSGVIKKVCHKSRINRLNSIERSINNIYVNMSSCSDTTSNNDRRIAALDSNRVQLARQVYY